MLTDATSELVQQRDDVKFLIVGHGPEADKLENQAKELGLEGRLAFSGLVPNDQLPAYYAASDVFAFHSWHEGLGIVLLGAMSTGKPIVTTEAGGTVDLVRDGANGYIVSPGDTSAFSRAILRVLDDPETQSRLSADARRMAEQEFAWDVVADKYMEVFRQAMDAGK